LSGERIFIILDTTGFIAKYHLSLDPVKTIVYTTSSVVSEVKDYESREALDLGLDIGRVNILDPPRDIVESVYRVASRIGEHVKLSRTDVEIAGLALYLSKRGRVVVITDDYSLQNLLYHLNISFKPLRTTGIDKPRKYIVYCSICGYVPGDKSEVECPICGAVLKRRVNTSS